MKWWGKLGTTLLGIIGSLLLLTGCQQQPTAVKQQLKDPKFSDIAVHDPSVIKANGQYYVIGSHMQTAKTKDFIGRSYQLVWLTSRCFLIFKVI